MTPPTFLTIPPEIREEIYAILLSSRNCVVPSSKPSTEPASYRFPLSLLLTSRQIHHEAIRVFQDTNTIVKITTPWPEAIDHIKSEGLVPCICEGDKAAGFNKWHLWAYIDSPQMRSWGGGGMYSMLICVEDLRAFARMWHFSNLHHQGLNQHLRLKITMQDPHVVDRKIPKALQQQLLMPFGLIKDLNNFEIIYEKTLPSIVDALTEERNTKDPTMDSCIEKAFSLKDLGNQQLQLDQYSEALKRYFEAFEAVHVVIAEDGLGRTVHADGFYVREIIEGRWRGMRGDYVRMILRVQLVANIVHTYLKLQKPQAAHYWGSRSILIFRSSFNGSNSTTLDQPGDLDFLDQTWATRFPAHEAMGKIFARTAAARRTIEKEKGKTLDINAKREVLGLMRAASQYLPGDSKLRRQLKAVEEGRDPESICA